jgi:hypothetical protein
MENQEPSIPTPPLSPPASQEIQKKRGSFLKYVAPLIFFLVMVGISSYIGFKTTQSLTKEFYIGALIISLGCTAVFNILTIIIRKLAKRFGKIWGVITWVLIVLIALGGIAIPILNHEKGYRDLTQNDIPFQKKSFYEPAGADWKTYINEPYDLSLRYPSEMKLDESFYPYGFNDVAMVNLERAFSSTTSYIITIAATKDTKKCDALLANLSLGVPPTAYSHTKTINGKDFIVGSGNFWTASGPIYQQFGYVQRSPMCKVITAAYATIPDFTSESTEPLFKPGETPDMGTLYKRMNEFTARTLNKIDYTDLLREAESIIGSMETEVKDIGTTETMYANESEYVIQGYADAANSITYAATRIYARDHSYENLCEDAAVATLDRFSQLTKNPEVCRDGPDGFIDYVKMDNRYGYMCADLNETKIALTEPTGLTCKFGTSVNGMYKHIGLLATSPIHDCGILQYKTETEQSGDFATSECFNKAINSCDHAVISGVVNGLVSTVELGGKEGEKCVLYERYYSELGPNNYNIGINKCLVDPMKGWPSLSNCIELEIPLDFKP